MAKVTAMVAVETIGGALAGEAFGPGIQQRPPNLTGFRFPRFQDFTVPEGTYGNYAHNDAHSFNIYAASGVWVQGQVNSHKTSNPAVQRQPASNWLRQLFPKQIGR